MLTSLLAEHGELQDTVLLYSHDNGGVPYAGALNYPLRGAKATAYEGGVRWGEVLVRCLVDTPVVFRSPGFIHYPSLLGAGGRDHPGLFHVADFLPTLVSLVAGEWEVELGTLDGVNQVAKTAC